MSLEDVREKKNSIWLYVIIGFLLIGMAGFGTSQFGTGAGNSSPAVLKTSNAEITQMQFDRTLNANRQQFADLPSAEVEAATLLQLQQRLALTEYLHQYPLAASNVAIDEMIRNDIGFQENGQFSEARFRREIPVEPQAYRNSLSKDLAMRDFQTAIASTGVISNAEITPFNEFQNLSRDILVAKLARDAFPNTADDTEIQAYYDAHKDQYMTDEQFDIAYVDFNPASIADAVQVSDAEILAAAAPPRGASYYLFTDEAAANQAVSQITGGKSLADVKVDMAAQIEDSGELGELAPKAEADSLIPQNAVDAIFALAAVGDITAPITVDGSVYVFELTSKSDAELSDNAKLAAKQVLQAAKVAPRIAALSEQLNKAVFETQAADLNSIAESVESSVQQSGLQSPNHAENAVLALPEIVQALQSGDKTTGKLQEPITIGERVIIYRIDTVKAPEQKPLVDVRTAVEQAVIAEKTDKQIAEAAKALIEKTQTEGLDAAAKAKNYPLQAFAAFNGQVDENPVLDAIGALLIQQQAPVPGEKNAQEIQSMTGDTYVYVNTDIRLGQTDEGNAEAMQQIYQSLAASIGQLELSDFVKSITSRADIQVHRNLLPSDNAN